MSVGVPWYVAPVVGHLLLICCFDCGLSHSDSISHDGEYGKVTSDDFRCCSCLLYFSVYCIHLVLMQRHSILYVRKTKTNKQTNKNK